MFEMMKTLRTHNSRRCAGAYLSLCLLVACSASQAAGSAVLVEGSGVSITSEQAQTELLALPPDIRQNLLGDAARLREWLDTIYLRKALAAQAEAQNLSGKSAVQYQLQTTRESVLANAQLLELEDAALPSASVLDAQARAKFTAEKERFNLPTQTLASHILVKGLDDASRVKAQQLLDQIKAGASFEELARKQSEDPGSAARGGSLGWFPAGRMVPAFDSAIAQLKNPGDLSPLVQSQFGYHIIRLDDRKASQAQDFESVRDQLIAPMLQTLRAKTREAEFKRVGDAAKIDASALEAFRAQQRQRSTTQSGPAESK